jgi:hypothetical protein
MNCYVNMNSNVNQMWIIQKSKDLLTVHVHVEFISMCNDIKTFGGFSTLYTTTSPSRLKDKLK